jgi:hypothetical protein
LEPSTPREHSAAEKTRVAERVAERVLEADPAVLSLMVLDVNDGGRVLAVARSPSLPSHERADPGTVQRFAIAAVVVWGAARQAAQLMGKREFIVGAFREQMVLLADLGEYEMLLAIRLGRSSNAEHVYTKVASSLGLR